MSVVDTTTGEELVKKSKSEKLAEAKLLIKQQAEHIAELEKKLEQEGKQATWARERAGIAEARLEEMHVLFDGLEGCVGRKTSDDWHGKEFSLAARFASWLAGKRQS